MTESLTVMRIQTSYYRNPRREQRVEYVRYYAVGALIDSLDFSPGASYWHRKLSPANN
jgi:hypothetical protein